MADKATTEERRVEVNDPSLSPEANRLMTEAVREIIGVDTVRVPVDRPRPSQGERPTGNPFARATPTVIAIVGVIAVGAGVGMIVSLIDHRWWTTGVAFLVLIVALFFVTMTIIGLASTTDYSDPTNAAALSELGVSDIEPRLSEIVREFTPVEGDGDRTVHADENSPAAASAEQHKAGTPSGGPSEAVGPGE
jgi:hypothetical protein